MITKSQSRTTNKGFTLIELLVVMGVIGVIVTSTFAVFTRFNRQQNLTIAKNNLKTDLAEAKANAFSHVVDKCKISNPPLPSDRPGVLVGYQLEGTAGSNKYRLREVCRLNSTGTQQALDPFIKEKTLPKDVTFQNSFAIIFYSLSNGANPGNVVIRHPSVANPVTINVSNQGVIQ